MIGLYGGSFDPPHKAHLECIRVFWKSFPMAKALYVIPNYQSPLKNSKGSTKENVEKMVKIFLEELGISDTHFSDWELNRRNKSYTIETVLYFRKSFPFEEIFFIIGGDNLLNFHLWKDYEQILQEVSLLVVPRLGYEPKIPDFLKNWQKKIIFLNPECISPISSSAIRNKTVKLKENLTPAILNFILEQKLYGY
jgi:nicotinate-nucleotide adenylyltransferase